MDAGRRLLQPSVAVERFERRQRRVADAGDALAEPDGATQHLDEEAGEREVRPRRTAGGVDEDEPTLAAPFAGDERRSVAEPRPSLAGEIGGRLGKDLPRHGHVLRHGKSGEGTARREGSKMGRLLPGQRPANRTTAAAERHWQEVVAGAAGEGGAGEA